MKKHGLVLLCIVLFCGGAFGRTDANSSAAPGYESFKYSLKQDMPTLPERVWNEGGDALINAPALTALGIAAGASVFMHNTPINGDSLDNHIDDHYDNNPGWSNDQDEIYATVGGPGFHFAATGLWYGLAAASKDDLNRERAFTMLTALSITGATSMGLKLAVNNQTPNHKDLAWPSGHTASSFTVAAVLDEFYGPAVGIPAYLGASFIGYRMVASGDHWASDVVFGGVLGYIVGKSVASKHMKMEMAGFKLVPMFNETSSGLALVKEF